MDQLDSAMNLTEKILNYCKKNRTSKKTIFVPILLILFIWIYCFNNINIIIKLWFFDVEIKIIIKIVISVILLIGWLIFYLFEQKKLKNITQKYGVGLIFTESIVRDKNSRRLLVKNLKEELQEEFEIKVYEIDEVKKYLGKDGRIKEITLKDLNLWVVLKIEEISGGTKSKEVYRINPIELGVLFEDLTEVERNYFQPKFFQEADQLMNHKFDIKYDNSLDDSPKESKLLHIILVYFLILTQVLSDHPLLALKNIEIITLLIDEYNEENDEINFIKANLALREIDAYVNEVLQREKITCRFKNKVDMEKVLPIINKFETSYFKEFKNSNNISKEYVNAYIYMCNLRMELLIRLHRLDEAEKCLKMLCLPDSIMYYFYKFLMEASKNNYESAHNIIKKINRRRDLNDEIIEVIINAIEKMYNTSDDLYVKYCYALVNKYLNDRSKYIALRELLINDEPKLEKYLK